MLEGMGQQCKWGFMQQCELEIGWGAAGRGADMGQVMEDKLQEVGEQGARIRLLI